MGEKNLPPTYLKLKQAREQGQIAVSQDIAKAAKLFLINELIFACEPGLRGLFSSALALGLADLGRDLGSQRILEPLALMMALGIAATCIAAFIDVVATLAQTKMNFASKALSRGADRLNPGNNLKQLFSLKKVITTGIGLVKVTVLLTVGWQQIRKRLPDLMQMSGLSPGQVWAVSAACLHDTVRAGAMTLAVLAVLDYGYQRFQTYRDLRVDHEEQKRHYKEMEGDPHTKGARHQLAHEVRNEAPAKPSAVVVNPEHIAITLAYEFDPRTVPVVLAKDHGAAAQAVMAQAVAAGVPVFRHIPLARTLYAVARVGQAIPREAVPAVAQVYGAVAKLRQGGTLLGDMPGIYTLDLSVPEPPRRGAMSRMAGAVRGKLGRTP
jgi:type III secretion protein U